jgi:hypothetical protein
MKSQVRVQTLMSLRRSTHPTQMYHRTNNQHQTWHKFHRHLKHACNKKCQKKNKATIKSATLSIGTWHTQCYHCKRENKNIPPSTKKPPTLIHLPTISTSSMSSAFIRTNRGTLTFLPLDVLIIQSPRFNVP